MAALQLAVLAALLLTSRGASRGGGPSPWPAGRAASAVVFLKEQCYGDGPHRLEDDDLAAQLAEYLRARGREMPPDVALTFLPKSAVCEPKSRGLSAILDALAQDATRALIGSLEEDTCDVTSRLAGLWGKPLLSWSCPQITKGTQRLVPSLEETANAIVEVAKTLLWRSIVIITSDVGWWPVLANKIEVGLQELGVAPRHLYWEMQAQPRQALKGLQNSHAKVIILCSSLRSATGETILQAIDSLRLSQTILLAIDVSSFIPFLPRILQGVTPGDVLEQKHSADDVMQNDASSESEDISSLNDYNLVKTVFDVSEDNDISDDIVDKNIKNLTSSTNKFRESIKILKMFNKTSEINPSLEKNNPTNVSVSATESSKSDLLHSFVNPIRQYFKYNNLSFKTSKDYEEQDAYSTKDTGGEMFSSISMNNREVIEVNRKVLFENRTQDINAEENVENKTSFQALNSEKLPDNYISKTKDKITKENLLLYANKSSPTTGDEKYKSEYTESGFEKNVLYPINNSSKVMNGGDFKLPSGDSNKTDWIEVAIQDDLHSKYAGNNKTPSGRLSRKKRSWLQTRYEMSENISAEMKKSFVIITSVDSKTFTPSVFAEKSEKNEIFEHILEGLNIVVDGNVENKTKAFKFLFLDWKENQNNDEELIASHWRPLIVLNASRKDKQGGLQPDAWMSIQKVQPNFDEWFLEKGLQYEEDSCDGDFCIRAQIKMNSTHIIIIVGSAFLFCFFCIGIALILRNILLKKRLSKGPNKIVLTATDFVFPQIPDSRRVDEGIEAMLCCWLQQLQEFGGPEVEKPDLLKGSVGSLKGLGKGPSSNGSLAKNNFIVDHRIRYNGDLVQLKELPAVGTFELKSKAMDCLVLTHGLRHENINPFIGCLTDPGRPALVHEHCSRGSLEDVLMMDEIKLDWSFRLSLLTDLVRGMRYLHSTPLKVHGYLTSRNCVIDARWVLKVTDYGLPAFYEAQGIPPTAKNYRDLLWTAPELLRHCGLRRRGSQSGDVYSFGIIMQEVVVRGEPFCMLALSPEEIIEKVKKPPPLIRPSVSKGAAPPDAIHIMRQCWTEQPEMRPDFCQVHDLFRKLNHGRKVNFVDTMFQMLEKYSNNLEELIRERTEQLDMEKKKTEQLLNRMLPSYVAEKLKFGMPVDPEEFSEVSIYFSDIVGFTGISASSTPFQVVDLLNDLYTCFDATINAYNVYKVETIGDAYMVVGGLPVRIPDHAEQVATMALDLLHQSGRFKIRHLPRTPLHLRIGLHTGPCCAGVVGLTMPRYCLFGDTVNTASRMESTGSAWRIHLSQATRDKLEAAGGYALEYRGRTEVKGKGRLPTYWLLGKSGFDKALPTPPPLGLNETLGALRSPSSRLEEATQEVSIKPASASADSTEKSSHHFSIDKSFFSVENPSSKTENTISPDSAAKQKDPISKTPSLEIKTPTVESPLKKTQEPSLIPTITMDEDSQLDLDQICKAESVANTPSNKHPVNSNSLSQFTLGTPVSASEVAAALLGSSTTSLVSNRYKDIAKYKRSLFENADLSTPYNHYRCLSPSDSNISQLNHSKIGMEGRQNPGRLLKRQFSLDRADDSGNVPEGNLASQNMPRSQPRLCKQNSAGAAPDLERIEEVPMMPVGISSPRDYRRRVDSTTEFTGHSKSISTESLSSTKK